MDARTWLAQRVFVPLYERRWGLDTTELERQLQKSQYFSPERLREHQWERVRALVDHLVTHNPFYRRRLENQGFQSGDLRSWDDFRRLPLTTKDDLRTNLDEMISDGCSKEQMFHKRTGGSTGVPVHLYWDRAAHRFKRAVTKRHDAWAGYRLGTKRAALWGDTEKSYPWSVKLFHALCERTIYLDTLHMDERHLDDFVKELQRFRPRSLIGHAHSLFFLAEHLQMRRVEGLEIEGVISTAESLTESERSLIESLFGPVLFDRYGCEELSLIASECEAHDGMHTSAEGLFVEVVDETPEQPGRIVVTDLVNLGMPFLRYEVGDLARVEERPCACGRGLPRLKRVYGRVSDILIAPDGRRISGISILDTHIIHVSGVRQAQLVQDATDHVHVNAVADARWDELTRARLAEIITEVFGPEMRHTVHLVDRIEPTERGKYQFSICKIPT